MAQRHRRVVAGLTRETPAPGVTVWQPARGYRFGVEVYLLADFAWRGGAAGTVVDLGAGSGVVGLLLATLGAHVTAVEREPRWLEVLRRNAAESVVGVDVVAADVRTFRGACDLVVGNPPWFDPAQPIPPDPWKAVSRAMLHGDVADFVDAGLRSAPRVCVVTRVERAGSLRRPGSHVARRAVVGPKLLFAEVRPGEGPERVEEVDVTAAYARFSVRAPS